MNGQVCKNCPSFLQKVHHFEFNALIDFGIDPNWNVFENMVVNTTLKSNIKVQDH
jgi:hypothetical protein